MSKDSVTIPISGMHCAACVRRVEKALLSVPGVLDASVNLAMETATLDLEGRSAVRGAIEAVRRAGYSVPEGQRPRARRTNCAPGSSWRSQLPWSPC